MFHLFERIASGLTIFTDVRLVKVIIILSIVFGIIIGIAVK